MADISEKWGERVAERGFAQIPNYLLQLNQYLDDDSLSPVELLVLLQLAGTWWRKDELPFPSVATLAARCGTSTRQIQRAINRLEELKLVERVKRRTRGIITSNAYDLTPLVSFLDELSKVFPNAYPRRTAPVAEAPAKPALPQSIRQSFSHGRTKTVVVETRKRKPKPSE